MKLRPLGNKVVVKELEAEEKTKSGIVLPDSAKEKPQEAEIIAVGPGEIVDGKKIEMEVKIGERVIYSQYSGKNVKIDGEEFIIISQSDILAVVE